MFDHYYHRLGMQFLNSWLVKERVRKELLSLNLVHWVTLPFPDECSPVSAAVLLQISAIGQTIAVGKCSLSDGNICIHSTSLCVCYHYFSEAAVPIAWLLLLLLRLWLLLVSFTHLLTLSHFSPPLAAHHLATTSSIFNKCNSCPFFTDAPPRWWSR